MSIVIKQNVLCDAITSVKISKVSVTNKEIQFDFGSINLGAAPKEMLSMLGTSDVKIQRATAQYCKISIITLPK